MKKVLLVILLIVACVCSCAADTPASPKELTNKGEYNNCTLVLGDAEVKENKIAIHAAYTNNNETEPLYALCSFIVKAFQDDVAIDDISDINGEQSSLIKETKNGKTIGVTYLFQLTDKQSDVEILICTPTASEDIIGKKIYSVSDALDAKESE